MPHGEREGGREGGGGRRKVLAVGCSNLCHT